MERVAINPWQWSVAMGYNQAELVTEPNRFLFLAGQTAVDENGGPQHPDDMGAQIELALDNVEAVLRDADMTLANLVRMNIYVTDIDAFFASYQQATRRLDAAGVKPPGTLLGVARLAFPELMVELEGTAIA
jgi:enamine deaminase RidA (YjgF/YER057c/UK114 family)